MEVLIRVLMKLWQNLRASIEDLLGAPDVSCSSGIISQLKEMLDYQLSVDLQDLVGARITAEEKASLWSGPNGYSSHFFTLDYHHSIIL